MKRLLLGLLLGFAACAARPQIANANDRQLMASLVDRTVRVECPDGGWGSGVILGPHPIMGSIVATAAHVADDECTDPLVRGTPAVRVAWNEKADVALLWVLRPPLPLLEQSRWYLGMPIVTVGYPKQILTNKSALMVSRGHLLSDLGAVLRVSSPAFFGNSGGPVFDEDGRLVGLLVMMNTVLGVPVDGAYYATPAVNVFKLYEAYLADLPRHP